MTRATPVANVGDPDILPFVGARPDGWPEHVVAALDLEPSAVGLVPYQARTPIRPVGDFPGETPEEQYRAWAQWLRTEWIDQQPDAERLRVLRDGLEAKALQALVWLIKGETDGD